MSSAGSETRAERWRGRRPAPNGGSETRAGRCGIRSGELSGIVDVQLSEGEKLCAEDETSIVVHSQQMRGGPTYRCEPDNPGALEEEVFSPEVATGVEQVDDQPGLRVHATEVGSLVRVAAVTGQAEVVGVVGTAVLPGDDVFHMEGVERDQGLGDAAVLAAVFSPACDQLADVWVHYDSG